MKRPFMIIPTLCITNRFSLMIHETWRQKWNLKLSLFFYSCFYRTCPMQTVINWRSIPPIIPKSWSSQWKSWLNISARRVVINSLRLWQGITLNYPNVWGTKPSKVLGVVQDITQRKEEELEKQHLEIKLLQAQKIKAIGTLAGGIAHDFNNILYPIIGFTEMSMQGIKGYINKPVLMKELTAKVREVLDEMD